MVEGALNDYEKRKLAEAMMEAHRKFKLPPGAGGSRLEQEIYGPMEAALDVALAHLNTRTNPQPAAPDEMAFDDGGFVTSLKLIRQRVAGWIRYNQEHCGGNNDSFIITPPVWPTIGELKAWVVALDEAQAPENQREVDDLRKALSHAIFLLEVSLKGQRGAFVNTAHEEELPYLKRVVSTSPKQTLSSTEEGKP